MAAKQHLVRARERARRLKLERIGQLLDGSGNAAHANSDAYSLGAGERELHSIQECSRMFHNIQEYSRMLHNIQEYSILFHNIQEYSRMFHNI